MSTPLLSTDPPVVRRRPTLPAGLAFTGAAITFTSLYLAAGALTPLLVVYKDQWSFSASLLTLAFAAYAVGFLAALLTLGSLSDRIGRRPVLIGALTVQLASNVMFLVAPDIGWVIAARIVQGVAGGAATDCLHRGARRARPAEPQAAGRDPGQRRRDRRSGLRFPAGRPRDPASSTAANAIVFVVLTIVTILGIVVVAPVARDRDPRTRRAPIADPARRRPARCPQGVRAAAPVLAAVWMLAGLSGGLAPSMVRSVFHLDSGLLNGVTGFVAPADVGRRRTGVRPTRPPAQR